MCPLQKNHVLNKKTQTSNVSEEDKAIFTLVLEHIVLFQDHTNMLIVLTNQLNICYDEQVGSTRAIL